MNERRDSRWCVVMQVNNGTTWHPFWLDTVTLISVWPQECENEAAKWRRENLTNKQHGRVWIESYPRYTTFND